MFRVQVQNIRGDQRSEFHVGSYTSFYWIGLHSVGLHTSCHWIVRQHSIGSYTSCHWIGGHIIRSETSFDRASGFLKKVCFPECFSRYVSENMAAHVQGKHRTARQEQLIVSDIKTVLLNVMNEPASNADLDYGLYKLDWLCSLVLRLTQSFSRRWPM